MGSKLFVSSSPHIHTDESVRRIMWMVSLSLLPAGAAGVFIFGPQALWVILAAVLGAVVSEALIQLVSKKKVTLLDGSAALTGLLLAFNLPASVPLWLPFAGSFFAIVIAKHLFGGLGQNIFNPALAGRAFLMASWPTYMTAFTRPLQYDAVTSATPLALLKEGKVFENLNYVDLLLGRRGGCIGEVCVAALLLGAVFLLAKGYISWHIPGSFLLTSGVLMWVFGPRGYLTGDWVFHLLSGGLILGAFFMATDYVTSPLTRKGQLIFGAGCGLITAVVRLWGGYPEGASYAILMMNAATPIIDRYTKNRVYGSK